MPNEISFMGANLVAQQLDWSMTEGWGQGDAAANAHYAPIETFRERFNSLIEYVVANGFSLVDVWTAQLNWEWATEEHLRIAREVLDGHGVRVASYAGEYGSSPDQFQRACEVAGALGTRILGGNAPLLAADRDFVVKTLIAHDLCLAIENHAEKTSDEMLARIGDGANGRIGTALDTGWYGSQGYDAARAVHELRDHLFYLHLKDVRGVGAHDTCRFGEGIVRIRECVEAARELGYSGPISVEHEPERFDPTDDCVASREMLEEWLSP